MLRVVAPLPVAVLDEEEVDRSEAEHREWIAIETVPCTTVPRQIQVLPDGECVDVAEISPIQITRCTVMNRVGTTPVPVRRQQQHADDAADEVVQSGGAKERAVTAVVLEDEQSDLQSGGRHRQQQRQPIRDLETPEHGQPVGDEQRRRRQQLKPRLPRLRLCIGCQQVIPVSCQCDLGL